MPRRTHTRDTRPKPGGRGVERLLARVAELVVRRRPMVVDDVGVCTCGGELIEIECGRRWSVWRCWDCDAQFSVLDDVAA